MRAFLKLEAIDRFEGVERMMFRNPFRTVFALAFSATLGALTVGQVAAAENAQASAIPADVTDAIARMGKTLEAKEFAFQSDTLRAYVGANGKLLHIAHNTGFVIRRPDRLLADASGDDGAQHSLMTARR